MAKSMLNLDPSVVMAAKKKHQQNEKAERLASVVNTSEIKKEVEKESKSEDPMDRVRNFYIRHSSRPTYDETAKRFNIDPLVLSDIAKSEQWFEQRMLYWAQNNADQQQLIFSANESIFKSLSIVSQLAIKEHAEIMLEIDRAKKRGEVYGLDSKDATYNIKDAMALVKLLNTNTDIVKEQLKQSDQSLKDMSDSELDEMLSEDERNELMLMFYGEEETEAEEEEILNESSIF